MRNLRKLILSFLLGWWLLSPWKAQAQLIISEVLPNPPTGQDEFVELYNNSSMLTDLNSWKLDDVLNGGVEPPKALSGLIEPNQYLAVYFSRATFNNDGDEVNLLDPAGNNVIKLTYPDAVSKKGFSYSLVNNEWVWTETPTPNQPSQAPQPQSQPQTQATSSVSESPPVTAVSETKPDQLSGVFLTEILPNPKGSDASAEFIELYNSNGYSINIGGWQLDDATGGSHPYTVPKDTILAPLSYLVFYAEDTRIALNNDGDQARLFLPSGNIADTVTYQDTALEGIALAKTSQGIWGWTKSPTPGQLNIFEQPINESTLPNQSTATPPPKIESEIQPSQKTAAAVLAESENRVRQDNNPQPEQPTPLQPKPLSEPQPRPIIGFGTALIISLVLAVLAVIIKGAILIRKR